MSDEKENGSGLIISEKCGLRPRSTDLVRRGLDSIPKTQRRVLRFPKHRSMGMLYLEDGADFYAPLFGPEELGDARGHVVVTVPGEKTLSLVVSTDASSDLSPLASLEKDDVEKLVLSSTQITDSGLADISELSGLKALSLSKTGITDFGLASLRKLRNLECLDLSFTSISDIGLLNLQELSHLHSLDLRGTKVSFEGLLRFRSTLRSDCDIEADEMTEANFVKIADSMIQGGEHNEAAQLLTKGVALMPRNWKPTIETGDFINIAFWNDGEFEAYIELHKSQARYKSVMWTFPSYSKAYYLLAYLAAERRSFGEALEAVNKGLDLEPDHPKMLCEKGFILRNLNRPEEALETYQRAATARAPIAAPVKAEGFRGQGFSLMDLNRLDEAESVLRDSLSLEPKNDAAIRALNHIENMKPWKQTEANDRDDPFEHNEDYNPPLTPREKALRALYRAENKTYTPRRASDRSSSPESSDRSGNNPRRLSEEQVEIARRLSRERDEKEKVSPERERQGERRVSDKKPKDSSPQSKKHPATRNYELILEHGIEKGNKLFLDEVDKERAARSENPPAKPTKE